MAESSWDWMLLAANPMNYENGLMKLRCYPMKYIE